MYQISFVRFLSNVDRQVCSYPFIQKVWAFTGPFSLLGYKYGRVLDKIFSVVRLKCVLPRFILCCFSALIQVLYWHVCVYTDDRAIAFLLHWVRAVDAYLAEDSRFYVSQAAHTKWENKSILLYSINYWLVAINKNQYAPASV